MVYHSKISAEGFPSVCDCPILPLAAEGQTDIVDEAILYFRANVLFRSFKILSSSDKLLIYLTLFISQCLQRESFGVLSDVYVNCIEYMLSIVSFLQGSHRLTRLLCKQRSSSFPLQMNRF